MIEAQTLQFLRDLALNNNKDWFLAEKSAYQQAHQNASAFAQELLLRMQLHDRITPERGGSALYRMYNDLRFHKNKPPLNPRFAGGFHRLKPMLRGGYYFHIQPGASYLSCGFFGPNAEDMKRIRRDMDHNHEDWKALLAVPLISDTFGRMEGEELKTAPAGYPKDHPGIEFLRYKQLIFRRRFTDAEVLAPDFVVQADATFQAIRPFFDYMSELLTTDANGVSLF
jgi:uncharacterized protein (TIGR02453 family)